ncbi:hypothetical protein HYH03_011275 [Edaphochlamys debaryana]|uniref:FAD dependent oxidoreductase domain-containing protein n=1 Tax=Edaphochlamys debaryana TaxID=47281 RepID=A0A835Y0J4_9CHLO|nr:hypothetical protein HYH03_011275 [Edaphochlamys debaryana]|eukprot:KAG2490325.1 hypothetical protein HYH03_011275 [Edaphochlamys debaryana]
MAPAPNVIVVGAGIVGSAIAHKVARAGAKVRVLDPVTPGTGGATRMSWAWINANKKHPEHYRDLNLAGLRRWKAEWPLLVRSCGSLVLGDDDPLAGTDPAYPATRLSPEEVQRAEPALSDASASLGGHLYEQEAWVDPVEACAAMLAAAREAGAEVHVGAGAGRAERLLAERGSGGGLRVTGVETADGATHAADVVVLAAGVGSTELAAGVGVALPLLHKPAVAAVTSALTPGPPLVRHLLSGPGVFVWQRPDGTLMLGDTVAHEDASPAYAASLLARATQLLPPLAGAGLVVEAIEAAYRPWPADGHPIVGPVPSAPGLYVALMHSGVTLAPEVGALAAAELAAWDAEAGRPDPARGGAALAAAQAVLAPYRMDRDFEEGAKRAAYGWK